MSTRASELSIINLDLFFLVSWWVSFGIVGGRDSKAAVKRQERLGGRGRVGALRARARRVRVGTLARTLFREHLIFVCLRRGVS